jgi:DNA replication protein DnaC
MTADFTCGLCDGALEEVEPGRLYCATCESCWTAPEPELVPVSAFIIPPLKPTPAPIDALALCGRCHQYPREPDKFYCARCRQRNEAHEQELSKKARAIYLDDVGFGHKFDSLDRDDHNRKAIEAAEAWPADDPEARGVYIWGDVGTGKTTLAQAIGWKWLNDPYDSCRFVVLRDLLHRARVSMSRHEDESPIEELFRDPIGQGGGYGPSLLIIDDLGSERPTAWAREILATIVEHRYRHEAPWVVTSNYSPSQLVKRLAAEDKDIVAGKRIVSRLVEYALIIHLPGPDRRVQRHEDAA